MVKQLVKHGNSYALIIDKPIMELLHITPESQLEVSTNGKALTITPVSDAETTRRIDEAMAYIHSNFSEAMKKLAEGAPETIRRAELIALLRAVSTDYALALRKLAE